MKTSEMTGAALDWAVAKCEGMGNLRKNPHRFADRLIMDGSDGNVRFLDGLNYSTDWSWGGLIIERELISLEGSNTEWTAMYGGHKHHTQFGETPLVAAMRCYVASRLGDEIEVPEELV